MKRKVQFTLSILAVLCILVLASCASTSLTTPENVTKIVEIPNTDKNTIFKRANTWMVDVFKNADSVIQYTDKEEGILKGKFTFTTPGALGAYWIHEAIITIETKDAKSRITIDYNNSRYYFDGPSPAMYKLNESVLNKYTTELNTLLFSFEKALNNTSDTNW